MCFNIQDTDITNMSQQTDNASVSGNVIRLLSLLEGECIITTQ